MLKKMLGNGSIIMTAGLTLVTLMGGSVAVDFGLYFAEHQRMQTAADASALAGTVALFRSDADTPEEKWDDARAAAIAMAQENGYNLDQNDISFGYSDPTGSYDAATFNDLNPEFDLTGGSNSVRVNVRRGDGQANGALSTLLAKMIHIDSMSVDASSTAIYGGAIEEYTGLRPVYLCQGIYNKAKELYGDPTQPEITLYDSTNGSNGNGNGNQKAAGDQETLWYYATENPGQYIEFWNATLDHEVSPLGANGEKATDSLRVDMSSNNNPSTVTTTVTVGAQTQTVSVSEGQTVNVMGFDVTLTNIQGKKYFFDISSVSNTDTLSKIKFDFGNNKQVGGPHDSYWTKRTWNSDTNTDSGVATTVSIGASSLTTEEACGSMPPGSFGFAELSNANGAVGVPTVRSWWENGFDGPVKVGEEYEPEPGNQLNAYKSEIDQLIADETVITVPLYSQSTGQGANAKFLISGIAPFVITELQSTGNPKTIKGHFAKMVCNSNCKTGDSVDPGAGATKIRLVH